MLVAHVFPEFQSSLGYMRARACWMLHYFAEIKYSSEENLQYGLSQVRRRGGAGGEGEGPEENGKGRGRKKVWCW